jgi:hypothetical protein
MKLNIGIKDLIGKVCSQLGQYERGDIRLMDSLLDSIMGNLCIISDEKLPIDVKNPNNNRISSIQFNHFLRVI